MIKKIYAFIIYSLFFSDSRLSIHTNPQLKKKCVSVYFDSTLNRFFLSLFLCLDPFFSVWHLSLLLPAFPSLCFHLRVVFIFVRLILWEQIAQLHHQEPWRKSIVISSSIVITISQMSLHPVAKQTIGETVIFCFKASTGGFTFICGLNVRFADWNVFLKNEPLCLWSMWLSEWLAWLDAQIQACLCFFWSMSN